MVEVYLSCAILRGWRNTVGPDVIESVVPHKRVKMYCFRSNDSSSAFRDHSTRVKASPCLTGTLIKIYSVNGPCVQFYSVSCGLWRTGISRPTLRAVACILSSTKNSIQVIWLERGLPFVRSISGLYLSIKFYISNVRNRFGRAQSAHLVFAL